MAEFSSAEVDFPTVIFSNIAGGGEDGEGEVFFAQQGIGVEVDRFEGVVEGEGDLAFVRVKQVVAEGTGTHSVSGQQFQMGAELVRGVADEAPFEAGVDFMIS